MGMFDSPDANSPPRHPPGARLRPSLALLFLPKRGTGDRGLDSQRGGGHGCCMEDRGLFNGRGFWALALLWLPAGVVAQALVRFATRDWWTHAWSPGCRRRCCRCCAGSLVLRRALRPAAGARLSARLAARLPARGRVGLDRARRGDRGVVGGGGAARPGLRSRSMRWWSACRCWASLVVARAPRLTADGCGPAAQQGGGQRPRMTCICLSARHCRRDRPPRRAWTWLQARSRHRSPARGAGFSLLQISSASATDSATSAVGT